MAINKNHEFDELGGVKCSIVERGVNAERAAFLRQLLEFNGYRVQVVAAAAKGAKPEAAAVENATLYDVGVTDLSFNPVNAVYGRMLRTPDGKVVTPAYWLQEQDVTDDSVPYFETPLHRGIGR